MSLDTISRQFTGEYAVGMTCWCSIQFAIPRSLYDHYQRRNEVSPGSFSIHCPMGHGMVPAGKTQAQREAERLKDELTREKHRAEQARADAEHQRSMRMNAEKRVAATKGQITKIKNRVGNGVCPCCNRYFANLHRHMTTQHPGWSTDIEGQPAEAMAVPMEPITVKRLPGDWRLARDWKKMASRRRALGLALAATAHAIGVKAVTLRAYESSGGALSTAQRYATFLNEMLKGTTPLSERGAKE